MIDTAQFDELKQLLAHKAGLHIPADAHDRFVSMLHECAKRRGYTTLDEYRNFLVRNEAAREWEEFVRVFTSGETFFFRDHGQFDLLRLRLLPELIAQHRNDKTLRLWSAGCASGEEAYSLAMLVDMLLPEHDDWNMLILGTDIDSKAIAKARHGRYGTWSFRMVPAALQQRYFHLENNEWVLNERIRRMVTFRVVNLIDETFPDSGSNAGTGSELHDMDMILCRNVFIYFDRTAVSVVAAKFSATLVEGGYLLTAHTELIGHQVRGLESRLFVEGVVHQRHVHLPAYVAPPSVAAGVAVQITSPLVKPDDARGKEVRGQETPLPPQVQNPAIALCASARLYADQGEYALAERMCRKALVEDPLAVSPYFLLAQLAQLKGDFEQAKECLNKAIYLDHRCVAAHLELAALYERAENMPQARALRHAALGIVRTMPKDEPIELYGKTAGELAQWLEQWNAEYQQ
jgi:chemotaxis protein methyltransferase CheR